MGGVDQKLTFTDYLALPAAHATGLKDLLVSPRLFKYRKDNERPDSDTLKVGRACHTAVLEPEKFLRDYILWDGGRRAGKEWDAFRTKALEKGRTILTDKQYALALKVRDAVHEHEVARKYVTHPERRTELSLRWRHERTGLECKARVDLLACGALLDLKTTRDPSPRKFAADAARLGYALQLALYRDGCAAALGELVPIKIIAAQNVPPYDVCVFDLPPETLAIGSEQTERALDLLLECTRTNTWPGIAPNEELPLTLPAWAAPEAEEELTMNGESLF